MTSSAALTALDITTVKIGAAHYMTQALVGALDLPSVKALQNHALTAQAALEGAQQRLHEGDLDRAGNLLALASNAMGAVITSYKASSGDRRMALSARTNADVALGILQAISL